jgi:hypothetical protein
MMSVYILFYNFAQIGYILYSGKISTVSAAGNNLFYLMNFNDLGMSLVTLFQQMIVNNWYDTVNMFCAVMGNSGPRVFFICWYSIATFIITNLVVAFVMDIYGETDKTITNEHDRRAEVNALYETFKDNPDFSVAEENKIDEQAQEDMMA